MAQDENNGNLRVVSAAGFLAGLGSSMMQAVWQPFVLSLGAPMSTLGLLESLGGWRGLVTALLQPISGWLADRLGRKPLIGLGGLAALMAVSLYVLAAVTHNWLWLLPGVILMGVAFNADPAMNSLVAESVHIGRRAIAYSVLMVSWMVPGIFAPPLSGLIADRWGFAPVFLLRIGLDGLRLALILWFLRETLSQSNSRRFSLGELGGILRRFVSPPRALRGFYWAMATDSFAWGLGLALLFGMLNETYGFSTFQLGVMSSALSIVTALSQMPAGRLIERHGPRLFLVLGEIAGILSVAGWLLSKNFLAFTVTYALFGLGISPWMPAQMALLADSVSERERGEAMGRLSAFKGLVAFPAPYLGGLLYDRFGFHAPILANLIGITIPLTLILLTVKNPSPVEQPQ